MTETAGAMRELARASVEVVPARRLDALREILDTVDRAASEGAEWFDVKLAVEEACTNLIDHGYGAKGGPIDLVIRADDSRIVVSIRDRAEPFSPDDAPPPDLTSEWTGREIGGLGWHLIKRLMDGLSYEPSLAAGNELTLVKRRTRSQEA